MVISVIGGVLVVMGSLLMVYAAYKLGDRAGFASGIEQGSRDGYLRGRIDGAALAEPHRDSRGRFVK